MDAKKLLVTYANGDQEVVPSDLTPGQFFDSRFGGLPDEVKEKCSAVVAEVATSEASEAPKPKASKK